MHNTGHNYGAVPESKWINGNLNNDGYAEGDYVPQRVRLTGLQAGVTQTLTFRYDRQVSGKYAFDFVADLQMSWRHRHLGRRPGNPPMPPAGAVFVTISFTPTASSAALYWEGHIASELDYLDLGLNLGAGSISGSNYHFFLESLSCGNVGSQTNQMKSSEVAAGQITVIKDAQPNSPQDFGFLIQAPNASNDTVLDDDSDPTRSNETHSRVAPGTTTVTETQVAGWTLASVTCTQTALGQTGGTAITPVSVDLAAGKVTVAVADDKNVTCTFVNTRLARVVVDKVWKVNGTSYSEADARAAFPQLDLASSLSLTGPAPAGASTQPWGTPRGGYVEGAQPILDETSHATSNLCGADQRTGHLGERHRGERDPAVQPDPAGRRQPLHDHQHDRLPRQPDPGQGRRQRSRGRDRLDPHRHAERPPGARRPVRCDRHPGASGHVSAGTAYVLSETGGDSRYVQNGAWTCSAGVVTTVDGRQRVVVEPGRSATCTVHNATAKVTLVKSVTNDDGGTATADQWTLHAGGFSGTSGQSFWVKPGDALALSESGGPSGYGAGPSSLTCSDAPGSQVTSVTPEVGASISCTFVNDDEPASLALTKVLAQGDSGSQTPAGAFTLTATPQSIAGQATESGAGGYPARPVKAGTYLLSESGPTGYTPGTWNCTGGTMGGSTGAQTVTVANGGAASCTITNTAITPTLTLVKDRQAGSTGSTTPATAWTLTANGPTMIAGSTGSTGASGVTGRPVPIGTYTLSESGPADGWTASDWVVHRRRHDGRHPGRAHRHRRPRPERHLHDHEHREARAPRPRQGCPRQRHRHRRRGLRVDPHVRRPGHRLGSRRGRPHRGPDRQLHADRGRPDRRLDRVGLDLHPGTARRRHHRARGDHRRRRHRARERRARPGRRLQRGQHRDEARPHAAQEGRRPRHRRGGLHAGHLLDAARRPRRQRAPGGRDLRHRGCTAGDRGRGPGRHLRAQRVRRTRSVDHGRLGLHRRRGSIPSPSPTPR